LFGFDVQDIQKIAIGGPSTDDYPSWNFMKNVIFSVQSAYHFQMKQRKLNAGRSESSSSVDEHKGWLAFWGANILGKVKVHVWRLIRNGLVVGAELQSGRIKAGICCVACGREETTLHRFWLCPHAQQVWLQVAKQVGAEPEITI
jgi:hypothetical protein